MRHFQVFTVIRRTPVYDFQNAVGMRCHPEGALEGLDEVVGELADKPDSIAEDDVFSVQVELAGGAVEGREQFVFYIDVSTGEAVREGRFSGVRVTDDTHVKNVVPVFGLALAGILDFFKFLLEFLDALADHAAVRFQLRLTRPLGADAAVVLAA